ncbi:hypothetical protein BGZ89_008487, partial [Linnemannia elongata]
LAHKGKAVQKRENVNLQALQDQIERLQATNAALVAEGEEKEAALAHIQKQFAGLEEKVRQRNQPNSEGEDSDSEDGKVSAVSNNKSDL